MTLKREHNNRHNKFQLLESSHTKRGLLIYLVFYWRRAKFEVEIHKEKLMASPLVPHGLEISLKVWVTWDEPEKFSVLVAEVKELEYPLTREYVHDLKDILQEQGIEEDEYDDDYVEFQVEAVDDEDFQML